MEEVPISIVLSIFQGVEVHLFNIQVITSLAIIFILIIFSAFISGSEVAFFSLSPNDIEEIERDKIHLEILQLLQKPNRLLATILIANNFINVAIVILSAFLTSIAITFPDNSSLEFIFQIVIITTLLVLFGEITPKVYANNNAKKFSLMMVAPLKVLQKIFSPLRTISPHSPIEHSMLFSSKILHSFIFKKLFSKFLFYCFFCAFYLFYFLVRKNIGYYAFYFLFHYYILIGINSVVVSVSFSSFCFIRAALSGSDVKISISSVFWCFNISNNKLELNPIVISLPVCSASISSVADPPVSLSSAETIIFSFRETLLSSLSLICANSLSANFFKSLLILLNAVVRPIP